MPKRKKNRAKRPPPPGLSYEGEDAKATFDKLRFEAEKAGSGRVEVPGLVFPTPDQVRGELRYQFDGSDWAAVVTQDADGDGMPVFRLWYQRGDRFQKSGIFPDGSRLVDYIRQAAGEKFAGFEPSVDTLDKLKHKAAASLVPECFKSGQNGNMLKCGRCPYERECEGRDQPSASEMIGEALTEEPEEVFMRRLKSKIQDQDWED